MPQHSALGAEANEDNALYRIQDNDDILLRVLGHLLKDSLQECRLVCRRWYALSQKLPVKIRALLSDDLDRLGKKYPKAAGLSFGEMNRKRLDCAVADFVAGHKTEQDFLLHGRRLAS